MSTFFPLNINYGVDDCGDLSTHAQNYNCNATHARGGARLKMLGACLQGPPN